VWVYVVGVDDGVGDVVFVGWYFLGVERGVLGVEAGGWWFDDVF